MGKKKDKYESDRKRVERIMAAGPPKIALSEGPRTVTRPAQPWRILTTIAGQHEERRYDTQEERDKEALNLSIANNTDVILEFWDWANPQDRLNQGWANDWVYRAGGRSA